MENIYGFNHYSFFTQMSELAVRNNSFDLSLGLPDFDIDDRLKYYLKESADLTNHHYEPLAGNPLLIENIIKFNQKRKNSIRLTQEQVSIVPCATFALYTSLKCIFGLFSMYLCTRACNTWLVLIIHVDSKNNESESESIQTQSNRSQKFLTHFCNYLNEKKKNFLDLK